MIKLSTPYIELTLKSNTTTSYQDDIISMSIHKKSILENGYVTYIYYNSTLKTIYIGETKQFLKRHDQHMNEEHFRNGMFNKCLIIYNQSLFTKTHAEDLENLLINHIIADSINSKYKCFNRNNGKQQHEYNGHINIQQNILLDVWENILFPRGIIFNKDLEKVRQSILYKYSPFKRLTPKQSEIEKMVLSNLKRNYKIVGGAGTGKTVLLMSLMYQIVTEFPDKKIGLVTTSNLSSRFNSILKQLKLYDENKLKFQRAGTLINNDFNHYDIIIVDESHRLQRYYPKGHSLSKSHFKDNVKNELELLSAKTDSLILFYDQLQSIRPQDIPRKDFEECTKSYESHYLLQQLRIIGNNEFDGNDFIKGLLYAFGFDDDNNFNPKVFDCINEDSYFGTVGSIQELFDYINEMEAMVGNVTNRVLAGYTRKWKSNKSSSKNRKILMNNRATEDPLKHIELPFDWIEGANKWRWNEKYERWSELPESKNEIGCIHAIQGADLDYIGVIIGPDIKVENNKLIGVRNNYKDIGGTPLLSNFDEEEFTEFLLDIYYVLLTRGIQGCRVYFEDKEVENYFMKKVMEGIKDKVEV